MSIKIIKPGLFTTIQDPGRIGYRAVGIGPGGAMDPFAALVANLLVGNSEKSALLEMHFPAAEIYFEKDMLVSITGGNFNPCIDDAPVALWKPSLVKKNQTLSFKKYNDGARAYLAIYGGLQADSWLNSTSTNTRVKAGGYKGRPFLKADSIAIIQTGLPVQTNDCPDVSQIARQVYEPVNSLRCLQGPEWQLVSESSKTIFSSSEFSITVQSDRMGYRLHGEELRLASKVELVSSPVCNGTLQLLPNGQMIVLLADHQTTGGYPRIANVISADLSKLAQSPIHGKLNFTLVDIENAEEALLSLQQILAKIKTSCDNHYAH